MVVVVKGLGSGWESERRGGKVGRNEDKDVSVDVNGR